MRSSPITDRHVHRSYMSNYLQTN
ncbi:hypothetical protein APL35_gp066 [Apis mellifera filamentous virus]|nr:hypothetical protein APL35_gp066 [Apis mellifera filamentous virus]